jgi:hypothetical protein
MKRIIAVLCGGLLATGLSVGAFAHEGQHKESTQGEQVTVTGELVDTACFVTSSGDATGKGHASCATDCMASGLPAGILPDKSKGDADSMLYLLINPKDVASYAAKTIKVEGKEYGNQHAIDVKHLYVQDGDNWKEIKLTDAHHNGKMGE